MAGTKKTHNYQIIIAKSRQVGIFEKVATVKLLVIQITGYLFQHLSLISIYCHNSIILFHSPYPTSLHLPCTFIDHDKQPPPALPKYKL